MKGWVLITVYDPNIVFLTFSLSDILLKPKPIVPKNSVPLTFMQLNIDPQLLLPISIDLLLLVSLCKKNIE